MIRINLLPVKQSQAQRKIVVQLAAMGTALGVMIVSAIVVHAIFSGRVSEREDQVAANQVKVKEYRDIIGEVEKAEKQRQRLKSQLQEIERLKRGKLGPVRVLDALSNNIPKRVWITSFKENAGNLELQGTGLENADISEFMRQLQKNKYFSNVRLQFTESTKRNGVTIFNFAIVATVDYTA